MDISILAPSATGWGDELLSGLWITVSLALTTLPFGLVLGLCFASLALSPSRMARGLAAAYVTVFRGLPELLTLFILYNGLGMFLNTVLSALAHDHVAVDLSPFLTGAVALALVFGAYAAEVFRGAFMALPPGQIEAAFAVGMSDWQVFHRIKFPQLMRLALPGLGNLWINLIKDTALVSVIALNDVMRQGFVASNVSKQPFLIYGAVCVLYWGLCILSETVLGWLEHRSNRGVRFVK